MNIFDKINLYVKLAYFQGGKDPEKTKLEPTNHDSPRQVLYKNYDLYEDGTGNGPGAGYHSLKDFKSVKEFLEHKRKRKDKLQKSKIKKEAMDFRLDNYEPLPNEHSHEFKDNNYTGGFFDQYTQPNDEEGKSIDKLNYATSENESKVSSWNSIIQTYLNECLNVRHNPESKIKNHSKSEYNKAIY